MKRTLALLGHLLLASAACSAPPASGPSMGMGTTHVDAGSDADADTIGAAPSWATLPAVSKPDAELSRLPSREEQYQKLCAQKRGDSFFQRVCGDSEAPAVRPNITDLGTLLRLVGLDQDRAFALSGNSTSLVAMSVSALNPRIVVFPRVPDTLQRPKELIAVGFVRGEQFVEVVSRDLVTNEPKFYLVSFEQDCSYKGGCDLASLLTEEIEHKWTAYSIYSDEDLEKTSFDCHACHQPGGFGTKDILRMQELASPWMHWFPQRFEHRTDSDRVLTAQFSAIHDVDTQYGGVPVKTIDNAIDEGSGAQLEAMIRSEGYGEQPNAFDPRIEAEAQDGGVSPTWLAQFQVSIQGGAITVPYPEVDVTDLAKRTAAVKSYRDVVSGAAARDTLVDIRDVFSDDAMEKLSFVPQPGADGHSILLQMCSRCHDGRANPATSRSRFNVQKLSEMPRDEKDLAITRLQQPSSAYTKMPPWRSARMTDESIQMAVKELSQ